MKLVRCLHQNKVLYAAVEGDTVRPIEGDVFAGGRPGSASLPLGDVKLLPVSEPTKVLAVGLNYRDHAEEFSVPVPELPNVFMKPNSCLAAHGDPVLYPKQHTRRVDYEAEFVVVVGKRARYVSRAQALDYVLGYTCGNDVTARDLQERTSQWTLCKGFDGFGPVGPWIETELDPSNLAVEMRVNGEVKQSTSTRHLVFDVPALIEYLSSILTLEPGDLIFTGTSSGVGPVQPGDVMEVVIEGIGTLHNPVAAE